MPESTGIPRGLAHVALRVRDIDQIVKFYTEVVGLTLKGVGREGRGPVFLGNKADTSHELALMKLPEDALPPDPTRVGMYHMAYQMESFEDLDALHERLKSHGAKIAGYALSPRSSNVMFFDPEGNELEAIWEPSDEELAKVNASGGIPRLEQVALS